MTVWRSQWIGGCSGERIVQCDAGAVEEYLDQEGEQNRERVQRPMQDLDAFAEQAVLKTWSCWER